MDNKHKWDFVTEFKDFRSMLFSNPWGLFNQFQEMQKELIKLRAFKKDLLEESKEYANN